MKNARGKVRDQLFECVLEEYGPGLRRTVNTYERIEALQEDLFQDVCLAVWNALPRFREESSLRTYVFRVAHNRAMHHVLKARRLRELSDPLSAEVVDQVSSDRPLPDVQLAREQEGAALHHAITKLPMGLRQAVALRLEGLSHNEIGAVLGTSENAVAIRLSRAKDRLERTIRGDLDRNEAPTLGRQRRVDAGSMPAFLPEGQKTS